jgi:hypothetical protein
MITFFSTTKNFDDKNQINQLNAIRSWTIGNKYGCEVILFQKSNGIESVTSLPNVHIYEEVRTNENGIPFISDMFDRASTLAKNEIVCFLNADIIVSGEFIEKLLEIHKKIHKEYLIVGQRLDSSFDFLIDFSNAHWYRDLSNYIKNNSTIHPPSGSDFFAFQKGAYNEGSLPDLLVGRPGWDLYMIYHARVSQWKVVNLSLSYLIIHQDHDYSHKNNNELIKIREDRHNLDFLPPNEEYEYTLVYCNYKYFDGMLKKTYHDNHLNTYYKLECKWKKPSIVKRILLKAEILFVDLFKMGGSGFRRYASSLTKRQSSI